jgi:methylglutaconyl-CoA hydratase
VRAAKALAGDVAKRALDAQLVEDTCERIARIRVSAEGQEGLQAFLNKRKPAWQGRQS